MLNQWDAFPPDTEYMKNGMAGAGMISYTSYAGGLKDYLSFGIPEFEGLFSSE